MHVEKVISFEFTILPPATMFVRFVWHLCTKNLLIIRTHSSSLFFLKVFVNKHTKWKRRTHDTAREAITSIVQNSTLGKSANGLRRFLRLDTMGRDDAKCNRHDYSSLPFFLSPSLPLFRSFNVPVDTRRDAQRCNASPALRERAEQRVSVGHVRRPVCDALANRDSPNDGRYWEPAEGSDRAWFELRVYAM